jgi:5-methylcytosine-specific restriction protein A
MAEQRFTVIVENDITQWQDTTGASYHFPRRYLQYLSPGTNILHYKGKLRDQSFRDKRLSEHPHYFAVSVAGESRPDPASSKGDMFVEILNFRMFDEAVHYKDDSGAYREQIPASREYNFWRDGVRPSSEDVFKRILAAAGVSSDALEIDELEPLTSVMIEGGKKKVYTTVYERKPVLRKQAIAHHGTACFACEADLGAVYGDTAKGFIHIHHRRPLFIVGETPVDPKVDLVPLCPTCHAIVHLGGRLRTVNEVRRLLGKDPIWLGE